MQNKDPHRYDDMLDMPHHEPLARPRMSIYKRAAQFAPFRALSGFDDALEETARLTEYEMILDDDAKEEINRELIKVSERISEKPYVRLTYFAPDRYKAGGSYITVNGYAAKIDMYRRTILLTNSREVEIDKLYDVQLLE